MNCAIAIFVKTPGRSPVKTRLWPELGRENAERLYLASAAAVHSVVANASSIDDVKGYWAVAENDESVASAWGGFDIVCQGQGGLGERMATVYRDLQKRHGGVILIGADAPQLGSGALVRAARWLRSSDARIVMGRATDGGFWLFGGNRELPIRAWTCVTYSTAETATELVRTMSAHGTWLELEPLQDLDTAADIGPVRSQLASIGSPTPEQSGLVVLLDELAASPGSGP